MNLSLTQIATALGGKINGRQVEAPGPGHSADDHSMSVLLNSSAPDGFIVNSFSGDDPIACKDYVRGKLGLPAFKPNGSNGKHHHQTVKPRVIATYRYCDASGALLYEVQRYDPKDFRQRRPDGRGGWTWKLGDVQRVLYRLPELLKYPDATVFVCEGEKDCDRLASKNHCATTISGGTKWTPEIVSPLKGRDVVVLEDNDVDGRAKALAAAHALHGVAASIRIVSLPDLPDKGDVSDWLNADPARAETFVDVCIKTKLWAPTDSNAKPDQKAAFELFWHGKQYDRANRPSLIKDLIPETGSGLLSGQWGMAKTFVALDLAASIVVGMDFAGHEVVRRGGVLFVAAEGASEIQIRLQAVVQHKVGPQLDALRASNPFLHASYPDLDELPFAWLEECPSLKTDDGYERLKFIVKAAADQMLDEFGQPLALIIIDTLSAVGDFDDANDAPEASAL